MSDNEQAKKARDQFLEFIRKMAMEFMDAQPISVPIYDLRRAMDRMVIALRALTIQNPKILECSHASLARALAMCALTGLQPGTGPLAECDLIPRKKSKRVDGDWRSWYELDWQIGWRGYVELTRRAGARIEVPGVVFHGEVWEHDVVDGFAKMRHTPDPSVPDYWTWEGLVAVYVGVTFADGSRGFVVCPKHVIEERRANSEAFKYDLKDSKNDSPWSKWPVEMAQKTAVRWTAQRGFLPLTPQVNLALREDAAKDIIDADPARQQAPALADYAFPTDDMPEREREPVVADPIAAAAAATKAAATKAAPAVDDAEKRERAEALARLAELRKMDENLVARVARRHGLSAPGKSTTDAIRTIIREVEQELVASDSPGVEVDALRKNLSMLEQELGIEKSPDWTGWSLEQLRERERELGAMLDAKTQGGEA